MQNNDINKIILKGEMGEKRNFNISGKKMITFSLAVKSVPEAEQGYQTVETSWHTITAQEKDGIDPRIFNVIKGQKLYVEGRMRKMQYTNANGEEKTYTEVIADKVKIINENDSTPELNKNSIDIWIWWCHNFTHPDEFIKRITDGECMRKHLSDKWKEKYNMYGPVAAMQQFYLDLDNRHRARLLDYIDSIKKDRI